MKKTGYYCDQCHSELSVPCIGAHIASVMIANSSLSVDGLTIYQIKTTPFLDEAKLLFCNWACLVAFGFKNGEVKE
jgi:hypothetical protein